MVRRTKQQKIRAQERRQQLTYSLPSTKHKVSDSAISQVQSVASSTPRFKAEDLFGYDTKYIYQDLRKTLIVTVLILVCLAGIFFYLRK